MCRKHVSYTCKIEGVLSLLRKKCGYYNTPNTVVKSEVNAVVWKLLLQQTLSTRVRLAQGEQTKQTMMFLWPPVAHIRTIPIQYIICICMYNHLLHYVAIHERNACYKLK